MNEALLSAHRLGRRFGERWIWRGLDLAVGAGERLAVTGPTGSGKSLLLRALAMLDAADEGEVRFLGRPLEPHAVPGFRARVAYLAQRPALAGSTVEEALRGAFAFSVHKNRRFDRERALRLLGALGRDEGFLASPAQGLSGGEAQIVALVRALLLEPRILLLDEFTASMDRDAAERAERLVRDWLEGEEGKALLITSHDPSQLDRLATRRADVRGAA